MEFVERHQRHARLGPCLRRGIPPRPQELNIRGASGCSPCAPTEIHRNLMDCIVVHHNKALSSAFGAGAGFAGAVTKLHPHAEGFQRSSHKKSFIPGLLGR